jgi:uncharacterized membrane protein
MILLDFTDYPHLLDVFCFLLSCLMFLGYLGFIRMKVRRNPSYTVQGITALARTAWVRSVMEDRKDILAVQTLRNSTMAATFLASTAILLTVGVLTLTGQGDKLRITWQALNFMGSTHESMLEVKLVVLLLDLFAGFFFFSSSIRLYNHVGYMINAPYNKQERVMSPNVVAAQLNRAGHHYSMGMRGFYSMVPLVFWIFGPIFLLASTLVMLMILFHLDRTPRDVEEDYRKECDAASCEVD